MSTSHAMHASLLQNCCLTHFCRRPLRAAGSGSCQRWANVVGKQKRRRHTTSYCPAVAAVVAERAKAVERIPTLPFVKIAGQEDMKLAILLNVIDPKIGGVLIMGDRGTGKSVAVRLCLPVTGVSICWTCFVILHNKGMFCLSSGLVTQVRAMVDLLPEIDVVPDDPFNSSPTDTNLMGPGALQMYRTGEKLPSGRAKTPLVLIQALTHTALQTTLLTHTALV